MIQLFHGDCIEVMKTLPSDSVDLVLTDIPYNEVNRNNTNGIRNLDKGAADVLTFNLDYAISEILRSCLANQS